MTHQNAPFIRRRHIDQSWTDAFTDPDFQSVCLIACIGLLIAAYLASAFPLDDNAINSIALLS